MSQNSGMKKMQVQFHASMCVYVCTYLMIHIFKFMDLLGYPRRKHLF